MLLAERLSPQGSKIQTVRVRVKGGYEPAVVHGRVGGLLAVVWFGVAAAVCFAVCLRRTDMLRVRPNR